MKTLQFTFLLLLIFIYGCDLKNPNSKVDRTKIVGSQAEDVEEEILWWDNIKKFNDSLEITDWRKLEFNRTDSLIQKFVKEQRMNYELFKDEKVEVYHQTLADIPQYLYAIKVNNDTLPDIIYSGPSGGEPNVFRIYINRKDTFQLAFEEYQYAKNVVIKNGLIQSFTIADPPCCMNNGYVDKLIQITHSGSEANFKTIKQIGQHYITEKPKSNSFTFIPFQLKSNLVHLRATCIETNEWNPTQETSGNIVGSYSKPEKGHILASQVDNLGRKWLFVELPYRNNQPDSSVVYIENKNSSFIRGWLNASDIQN